MALVFGSPPPRRVGNGDKILIGSAPPVSSMVAAAAEWCAESASLHRAVSDHQQDVRIPVSADRHVRGTATAPCRFVGHHVAGPDLLPGYRKTPVDRPVFIVGNPRSGTTFLHRLLLGSGDDLAAFELWEMLFPAITARKVLGPDVAVRPVLTGALPPSDIHDTNLRGIETDDVPGSSGPWTVRSPSGRISLAWQDTWGSPSRREMGVEGVTDADWDHFTYHEGMLAATSPTRAPSASRLAPACSPSA